MAVLRKPFSRETAIATSGTAGGLVEGGCVGEFREILTQPLNI